MTFEPLEFSHQLFIEEKLKGADTLLSEFFFPNFYLYRKTFGDKIHQGPFSLIETSTGDKKKVFTPLDPINNQSLSYYKTLLPSLTLFPIPDSWLPLLGAFPHTKEALEEDSDYIYSLEKMRFFKGRHLASRRNLLHQFLDLYPHREALLLTEENVPFAIKILEEWSEQKEGKDDFTECLEALKLFSALHLYGRLVMIDQKPAGFIMGGFQRDAFIVQYMKAGKEYKGIYPFLYQDLALSLPDATKWINLEPDLGIPSLTQAKKSYAPDQIALKWRVTI